MSKEDSWIQKWLCPDWVELWLSEGWVAKTWRNKLLLILAWPFFVVGGVSDFLIGHLEEKIENE